jgi:hypothetical protein
MAEETKKMKYLLHLFVAQMYPHCQKQFLLMTKMNYIILPYLSKKINSISNFLLPLLHTPYSVQFPVHYSSSYIHTPQILAL